MKSVGKGLYEGDFADIWFDERNKEVIMVNQYYYPDHALSQNAIRPMPLTRDMADLNQAILPLVMAFPKIDGTPLQLDLDKLATDKEYNQQFLTDFYTNRDPRFHATVFARECDIHVELICLMAKSIGMRGGKRELRILL